MINEEKAKEILGLDNVKRFDQLSPEGNDYGGYISKSHGYHMGSLVIDTVNEEKTLQVVQGMPKLQYLTKHSDELTIPKIYEKLDGSNIVMFPLLENGKCIEVLFKTRGTPTVQNKLMERVKIPLSDNYAKAVKAEGLSFAFEIYGTENPHMIQYQEFGIGARLDLLAVFDQNKAYPAPLMEELAMKYSIPMAQELFKVEPYVSGRYTFSPTPYFLEKYGKWCGCVIPIIAPTLWDGYFMFEDIFERINMAYQKEKGGSIIEGAVWHYTNAMGENCMLKSKATSIKKSHGNAAKGINAEVIRQTILKMDDDIVDIASQYNFNKQPLIEYIQKHLLEDYPESVVMDKKGINKVNGELAKFFRKPDELPTNLIDLAKEIREKNLEAASPQDLMRIFATEYQDLRSKSKSMFQAFERLLRAEERRKE